MELLVNSDNNDNLEQAAFLTASFNVHQNKVACVVLLEELVHQKEHHDYM